MLIVSPAAGATGAVASEGSAGSVAKLGKKMGILQNDKPNAALALGHVAKRLEELAGVTCVDTDRFLAAEAVPDDVIKRLASTCDWVLVGSCD
jgi:hypothetical protein